MARCPAKSDDLPEPERIRQCLEDFRVRPGAGPDILYHWGHPDSIKRMMSLTREEFCGFNQARQSTRQILSLLFTNPQAARTAGADRVRVNKIERTFDFAAVSLLDSVVSAEDLADIRDLSEGSSRVVAYQELLGDVLQEYQKRVRESRCQTESSSGLDCSAVDMTVNGMSETRRLLDTFGRALVALKLSLFPGYYAQAALGAAPVDEQDAAVAAQMLDGYLAEMRLFLSSAKLEGVGNDEVYIREANYRSSTTWGPGVYFGSTPTTYSKGHFAGGGIACYVGGQRMIDAFGRSMTRRPRALSDDQDRPTPPPMAVRRRQLIDAEILVNPSVSANQRYEQYVDARAFEVATKGELLRMDKDIYLSKCAIEYNRCGAITVFDYKDCSALGDLLFNMGDSLGDIGATRQTLFNYLRSGPTDGTQRDSAMGPRIFDSRLISEWRNCVAAQLSQEDPIETLKFNQKDGLCPDAVLGRTNLIGRRSGVDAGIYTDSAHPAGERYLPVIKEIGAMCRQLWKRWE